MARVWQTVLHYFDQHPWLPAFIGGAVAAMLLKFGRKPMMGVCGLIIRWRNKRIDERVWSMMPRGTSTLSDLVPLFKLNHKKTGASLRRLEKQGRPIVRVHVHEEDWDDEIWNRD